MKIVYGPVPSWRLGRSLGIDLICSERKTCTFDCIYCQLGRTKVKTITRKNFVSIKKLKNELKEALDKVELDVVTFSGTGEPTLAKNLTEAIATVKALTDMPLAILTNGSMLWHKNVRNALKKLDIVVTKLGAPNQRLFQKINNPIPSITLDKFLTDLKQFRLEYEGKLALEIMLVPENKNYSKKLAELARAVAPDEVQLNTPLRPCPVKPLTPGQLEKIGNDFKNLNVIFVYKAKKPVVKILDKNEILKRRKYINCKEIVRGE